LSATRQRVEPNWPAPAYIPAIVLLATLRPVPGGERWLKAGVMLAAAMSAVIYVQALVPVLPLRPDKDPIARAFGWREVARASDSTAQSTTAETGGGATTWLGGDRYQEASELAFYDAAHPETFATNLSGRENEFDLWPRFPERARVGDNLVLVLDDSDESPATIRALQPYFAAARRGALVTLRRPHTHPPGSTIEGAIGTRRLWILLGWLGGWPAAHPVAALRGRFFRPAAAHQRAIDWRAPGPMASAHRLEQLDELPLLGVG